MLAGHIDVVPEGKHDDWTYGPFSGTVIKQDLWTGRSDDKYAIAASYFALKAVIECGAALNKMFYCSVVDEEKEQWITGFLPYIPVMNTCIWTV